MLRRLFTIGCVVSSLICAFTVFLWLRSYWQTDQLPGETLLGKWDLISEQGSLIADEGPRYRREWQAKEERLAELKRELLNRMLYMTQHFGPSDVTRQRQDQARIRALRTTISIEESSPLGPYEIHVIPHWVVVAVSSPLPAVFLCIAIARAIRRRRASRRGLCLICGYDLRASPDVCPECGAVVKGRGSAVGALPNPPLTDPAAGDGPRVIAG